MMGFIRFILVVFISFAVPFVATANVVTPVLAGCPMQTGGDGPAAMTIMHDCCEHGSTDQTPSHACKAGQECKVCSAYVVIPAVSATDSFPDAAQVVVRFSDLAFFAHDPRGLWRPPRSL